MGADAVGGVVNFILKKNFEGLNVDGQVSTASRGDGTEYRVAFLMGAEPSHGGRGNVMMGAGALQPRHSSAARIAPGSVDSLPQSECWRDAVLYLRRALFPSSVASAIRRSTLL